MYVLAFKLALSHLRTNLLSRLMVVLSVGSILLMNGLVFLLFQSVSRSLSDVRSSQFLTAYLDSTVTPSREPEILSAVRKIGGVVSAQLISKDAFLENFSKYFPQLSTELASVDSDTIPRYLKIKVSDGTAKNVEDRLKGVSGIEFVELNQNKYAGLIGALVTLRKLALVLIGAMSVALLCVLINHFKLRTTLQAEILSTLTFLGAGNGQLLLPFAIEGLLEGFLGGVLAATTLVSYGHVIEAQLGSFFTAIGYHPYQIQLWGLAVILAGVGMASGMIGSVWATIRAKGR